MVTALGIDVRRAFTLVFAIGGLAAALAGVLSGALLRHRRPAARHEPADLRVHRRRDRRPRLDRRHGGRGGARRARPAVRELLRLVAGIGDLSRRAAARGRPARPAAAGSPRRRRRERRARIRHGRRAAGGRSLVLALVPKLAIDIPVLFAGSLDSPGTLQLLALMLIFAGARVHLRPAVRLHRACSRSGTRSTSRSASTSPAIAMTRWHWGFWPSVLFTAAVGLVLPLSLGAVSLRVGGIAFAMVTLAFAQAGSVLAFKNPYQLTGGEDGLRRRLHEAARRLRRHPQHEEPLLARARLRRAVVFLVGRWAVDSSPGHVWQAIRENELRVEVLGLRPFEFKLMSFVLASFLATLGGIVYLIVISGASPSVTTPNFTLALLVMVVIGGAGLALGRDDRRPRLHLPRPPARRPRRLARGLVAADGAADAAAASRSSSSGCSSSSSSTSRRAGSRGSAASGGARRRSRRRSWRRGAVKLAWESQGSGAPLLLIHGPRLHAPGLGPAARAARAPLPRALVRQPRDRRERDPAGALHGRGARRGRRRGARRGRRRARARARREPRRLRRAGARGATRPERVDRLVLACTSPGGAGRVPAAGADGAADGRGAGARRPRSRCAASSRTRSRRARPPALVDEIYAYRRRAPARSRGLGGAGRRRRGLGRAASGSRGSRRRRSSITGTADNGRRPAQLGAARRADPRRAPRADRGRRAHRSSGSARGVRRRSSKGSSDEPLDRSTACCATGRGSTPDRVAIESLGGERGPTPSSSARSDELAARSGPARASRR